MLRRDKNGESKKDGEERGDDGAGPRVARPVKDKLGRFSDRFFRNARAIDSMVRRWAYGDTARQVGDAGGAGSDGRDKDCFVVMTRAGA